MAVFQARNRIQILRDSVARVIARSRLSGLTRNSVIFHLLAAAANEDAEQYYQMALLRQLFSIDKATGSELDRRAAEIVPGRLQRRTALFATGEVTFSRSGTTGVVNIPAGTLVAARDAQGQIRYVTTAGGTIGNGDTASAAVPIVAQVAGSRANVEAGQINQIVSRTVGVQTVTNPAKLSNGRSRESDESFRGRLKLYVQGLSRGTPRAIESAAKNVILPDGRRVVCAKLFEPVVPTGSVTLYIDDGTGAIETFNSSLIGSPETVLASAAGGERQVTVGNPPIRDDGSLVVRRNAVALVRDTDYVANTSTGVIHFDETAFPSGLTAGDSITAEYRYYTGLIGETSRVINGVPGAPLQYPGVRAAGTAVYVLAPVELPQSLEANISVLPGFSIETVGENVASAIQDYVNGLDIGDDVIVSEIIERAMAVAGMFDFSIVSLTGGPPANQVVLPSQVARITAANITLT